MTQYPKIATLSAALAAAKTSSVELTENALARAEDPLGEGRRAFTLIDRAGAMAQAGAADLLRTAGIRLGPLMGLPISVKDLFDIEGQVTRAGSIVLDKHAPAMRDAEIVARLRRAGAIIVGRTNMVEFAYSGVGLNPHFGTPKNPWDRPTGRIPGGSSSGAAVSVSDGMCVAAIGTDTGGSVRIPAALCGLVGFKPTAARVPREGTLPLSFTLDSIGPLGASVECCRVLDSVLSGHALEEPEIKNVSQLRFLVPTNRVLEELDAAVASDFTRALSLLAAQGAQIVERNLEPLEDLYGSINPFASFSPAEAYAWHRPLLALSGDEYDPRVSSRIMKGAALSAADYIELGRRRADFMVAMQRTMADFDALLMPSVPIVAPPIDTLLKDDAAYWKANALLLRNTSMINFLDGAALSLPIHQPGSAPVGLAIAQCCGQDLALFAIGRALEIAFTKSSA